MNGRRNPRRLSYDGALEEHDSYLDERLVSVIARRVILDDVRRDFNDIIAFDAKYDRS